MPGPAKTCSSKHHHRHSEATLLRRFMDRKAQSVNWPYSCPPFPPTPAWFSINGVTYHQFPGPGGGSENIGMGVPVFPWPPADPRGIPGPRNQNASQPQQGGNNNFHFGPAAAAAAAGAEAFASPSRAPQPTDDNTNSPDTGGALVRSRPSSPMTFNAAMQCLSGQLRDAIKLSREALAAHAAVVATAQFTTAATRNGVWMDLLAHRFRNSGFAQDGFRNLGRRLGFYMEQAYQLAQSDPDLLLGNGERERRRNAGRRARRLRMLRGQCEEVVALAGGAARDVGDCRDMLEVMMDMKKLLAGAPSKTKQSKQADDADDEVSSGKEVGDEGDQSGETESQNQW